MWVVTGLGNPGVEYRETRHNVGFKVLDTLVARLHLELRPCQDVALIADGELSGQKVLLVQPQLYMNRSGQALAQLSLNPEKDSLVVVYDDLDLECGRLRIRSRGGTGGHRGVASVAEYWG